MNAQQLLKRLSQLKTDRIKHEAHWKECYKYCAPERQQSFTDVAALALEQERKQARTDLFDTTAVEGIQLLVSSIVSGTTSPVSIWFKSVPSGVDTPSQLTQGEQWLSQVDQFLFRNIHASNFDSEVTDFLTDLVVAGWAVLYADTNTGEVAPKSVDEYKLEREDFDFEEFKADESNKEFLTEAHKHGITNKQLDFLLSEYDKRAVDLVSNSSQIDTDTTVQTLQSDWGDKYEANIFNAVKAARACGITDEQINDPLIGNNVAFIKMASYFGSQMTEDKPVSNGTPVNVDISSLMRSEAFFNPKHPDHKSVKAQIDSYYDSLRK